MSYYKKYLKYKSKYSSLKKLVGGNDKYPAMDYVDVYAAEVKDPIHRPSSHVNNFNKLLKVYIQKNSVPFKNDSYADFINFYDNYQKTVVYLKDSELEKYKTTLDNNKITSEHILEHMRNLKETDSTDDKQKASNRSFIFIMDIYGNVFVIKKVQTEKTQINHTSMSKGRKVASAGWVTINDDFTIKEIANMTGHYQSSDISIYNFIKLLKQKDFNITNTKLKMQKFAHGLVVEEKIITANVWFEENLREYESTSLLPIDKIIFDISYKIYDDQIIADFVNFDDYFYLIFQKDSDLYEFVTRDLYDVFSFDVDQTNKTITQTNSRLFAKKKYDILEIKAKINECDVTIKITSYNKLKDLFEPKLILRQARKNIYDLKYLYNGERVRLLTLNHNIGSNSYLSSEYLLLNTNNNILFGSIAIDLLKESYKIAYSLGNYWDKFINITTKNILEKIIFEKNKCSYDNTSSWFNLSKLYSQYKLIYCHDRLPILFCSNNLWLEDTCLSPLTINVIDDRTKSKFNTLDDNELVNNTMLYIEKLIPSYLSTVKKDISTDDYNVPPLSKLNIPNKITINNMVYNIPSFEQVIDVVTKSFSERTIKIDGYNKSFDNLYFDDNNVYVDNLDRVRIIHPCVDIAKLIADILVKINMTDITITEDDSSISHNITLSNEQKILLEIVMFSLIGNLFDSIKGKISLKNWDKILRSAVFIELLKIRETSLSEQHKQIIEIMSIEVLNSVTEIKEESTYIFYLNKLINQINEKIVD
jgi:hypothetical protein